MRGSDRRGAPAGTDAAGEPALAPAVPSHTAAEAAELVDRYLLGKLSAAEAAGFEEHYISCPPCLERLETSEVLVRGLRRLAGKGLADEGLADEEAGRDGSAATPIRRPARWTAPALLQAAGLAAAVVGIAWLGREVGRLRSEVREVRTAGVRADTGSPGLGPALDPVVAFLSPLRSAAGEAGPTPVLTLGAATPWAVLVLEVDDPGLSPGRAELLGPGGGRLWQGPGPSPQPGGVLTLALPAAPLGGGDHVLQLYRAGSPPGEPPAARFPFRIDRQP